MQRKQYKLLIGGLAAGNILFLGLLLFFAVPKWIDDLPYPSRARSMLTRVVYILRDAGDLFYNLRPLPDAQLPIYHIEIDPSDLARLDEGLSKIGDSLIFSDDLKERVPAVFRTDAKTYNVEINYRGAQDIHWNADKKSYSVHFDKGTLFEDSVSKLNLIIPLDRKYIVEHLNNYRAEKMGFFVPQSHFTTVFINGKKHGIYFVQEGWSDELLTRHSKPDDGTLYKTKDMRDQFCTDRQEYYGCIRSFASLWEIAAGKDDASRMGKFKDFLDVFAIGDNTAFAERITKYIDVDQWLKWNIHYLLVQSYHQGVTNLRFYYNPQTSLFEAVPWDVGMDMNHQHPNIVSTRGQIDIAYNPFIDRLLAVPEFRHRRNELLWGYVGNDDFLEDDLFFYDKTFAMIQGDLYRDRLKRKSNFSVDRDVAIFRDNIIRYYRNLRDILAQGDFILDVKALEDGESVTIDIGIESFAAARLERLGLRLEESESNAARWMLYRDTNENLRYDAADELVGNGNRIGERVAFEDLDQQFSVSFLPSTGKIAAVRNLRFFAIPDGGRYSGIPNVESVVLRNVHTGKQLEQRAESE